MKKEEIEGAVGVVLERLRSAQGSRQNGMALRVSLASELGGLLRKWAEETEKRVLVSVAMVHSRGDFGSCAEIVARATAARISGIQQQRQARAIAAFWEDLKRVIPALRPDKVYQDGLPVCDERPEVVAAIVDSAQTPNYELLRTLRDWGAKVVGTESLTLLLQERARLQEGIVNRGRDELLEERDAFITERIAQTLLPQEVGVLLIGALHQLGFPNEWGIWKIEFPTLVELKVT